MMELDKPKSIFEVFAEKVKKAYELYQIHMPWYIMTSMENHQETVNFFEENAYFGLPKQSIYFFSQGRLPMLSENGKLMLKNEGEIVEAADGNGGIFEALYQNGVLKQMRKNNIEWLGVGNVDNILLNLIDPVWIGLAIEKKVELTTKSVTKVGPEEKVGSLCKINGKLGVVEYTEISEEMAHMLDEKGKLVYGESYFGASIFHINLLERIGKEKLPYHPALKKCNYLDEDKKEMIAEKPNAYKFESFIFDAFRYAKDALVLSVNRKEEFAPVKNATGVDSPETAKKLYLEFIDGKTAIKK